MRNFKLKDGYVLGQDIKGNGIVNLVIKKIDGSEDDVIVGQVIDGKYIIQGEDRELGKAAKLVYESKENDGYPSLIYASETSIPNGNEVDYNILDESTLSDFIEVVWDGLDEMESLHTNTEDHSDESKDIESEESSVEEVVEE